MNKETDIIGKIRTDFKNVTKSDLSKIKTDKKEKWTDLEENIWRSFYQGEKRYRILRILDKGN